jgi:hypothetical protein
MAAENARSAIPALQALIDLRCWEAREAIAISFHEARVRLHIAPVLLDADKVYRLPAHFKCPECGGRTLLEVYEWGARTGVPTQGGFTVHCKEEDDQQFESFSEDCDYNSNHRYWQSDWQPVCDRVARWMVRNVRVRV